MNGINREVWILALNGEDIFPPGFVASIEAAGWRCVTLADAGGRLTGGVACCLALLSVDRFTDATYDLIRFVAGVLELPVVVFGREASLSNVCESLRAGADDFIAIPYPPEEALARLNSVLNGRYRITAPTQRSVHLRARHHPRVAWRHGDPASIERRATGGERQ